MLGSNGDAVDVHEDSEVGEMGAGTACMGAVGPLNVATFGRPAAVKGMSALVYFCAIAVDVEREPNINANSNNKFIYCMV